MSRQVCGECGEMCTDSDPCACACSGNDEPEPVPRDLGTYHVIVKHYGASGFILKLETSGAFTPSNDDVGFGPVSPVDARWIEPSFASEEELVEFVVSRWGGATQQCDCEVHRLNAVGNDHFDEGHSYPCEMKLKLESLTLVRPNGERRLLTFWGHA